MSTKYIHAYIEGFLTKSGWGRTKDAHSEIKDDYKLIVIVVGQNGYYT